MSVHAVLYIDPSYTLIRWARTHLHKHARACTHMHTIFSMGQVFLLPTLYAWCLSLWPWFFQGGKTLISTWTTCLGRALNTPTSLDWIQFPYPRCFFCRHCVSLPSRSLMSIWDDLSRLVCMGFAPLVWAYVGSVLVLVFHPLWQLFSIYVLPFHRWFP